MGLLETLEGGVSGSRSRDSITRHLTQLFASAQRFASGRVDYGVAPDALLGGSMAHVVERAALERLRCELLRNVSEFETGLAGAELDVGYRNAQGYVVFELRGELKDGSGAGVWALRFSTWTRQIEVSEVR